MLRLVSFWGSWKLCQLPQADEKVIAKLSQEEIDELFNPDYYAKRVDDIFARLGL